MGARGRRRLAGRLGKSFESQERTGFAMMLTPHMLSIPDQTRFPVRVI